MRGVRRLALLLAPFVLWACPGPREDDPGASALVVGVQGEQLAGALASVHVVTTVDGAPRGDETLPAASALPKEFVVDGPEGAAVDVRVEAFAANAAPGAPPMVTRHATARIPASKKLLRVQLDPRCVAAAPGAGGVAACSGDQTCVAGRCAPAAVPDGDLEPYDPGWAAAPPDICRPASHGAPEVVVGTGQTDYAPLVDGQVVALEKGPQGGHHVWIAVRMKNLRQSGSTTMITSKLVGDPEPVPPAAYVFTFDPDEGAYCKLWGLRYQVDVGASDLAGAYKRFLGKDLEVTVTVTDSTKASASATRTIHIADKLVCPDGTDSCNTL